MPRAPHIPSYRLHKSTGQAVVTLDGRDHYLGRHNTAESRREYDRLIAAWIAGGRSLPPEHAPDLTVAELLAAYWSHVEVARLPNPHRIKSAIGPAAHLYGHTAAALFNGPALKACRELLVEGGHCRKHVNQLTDTLRRAFAWAVGEDLVGPDVLAKLQAVEGLRAGRTAAPESEPVRPADLAHVRAAQAHVLPAVRDLVELQLLTGARPGELVVVRPADVDTSGDVWVYRPADHKTAHRGKSRTIWFGPKAQAVLRPWLDRPADSWCFDSTEAEMSRRLALGQRTQAAPPRPYTVTGYGRAVRRGCDRAGVPSWHVHQLRHAAATSLVEQFGWAVAQTILGHSSLNTTKVYAEPSAAAAIDAMRKAG
jgi:integrase